MASVFVGGVIALVLAAATFVWFSIYETGQARKDRNEWREECQKARAENRELRAKVDDYEARLKRIGDVVSGEDEDEDDD